MKAAAQLVLAFFNQIIAGHSARTSLSTDATWELHSQIMETVCKFGRYLNLEWTFMIGTVSVDMATYIGDIDNIKVGPGKGQWGMFVSYVVSKDRYMVSEVYCMNTVTHRIFRVTIVELFAFIVRITLRETFTDFQLISLAKRTYQ